MTDHVSTDTAAHTRADFIAGLPKAELHVHHVGSASPRIVAELAGRHEDTPVPRDPELVADYFTFTDFAHFVEVYLSVVDLVRTPEDIRTLTYEIARDMTTQSIRYAELTCSPLHVRHPRHRPRGVLRSHRGCAGGCRAGLRDRAALVLRYPG